MRGILVFFCIGILSLLSSSCGDSSYDDKYMFGDNNYWRFEVSVREEYGVELYRVHFTPKKAVLELLKGHPEVVPADRYYATHYFEYDYDASSKSLTIYVTEDREIWVQFDIKRITKYEIEMCVSADNDVKGEPVPSNSVALKYWHDVWKAVTLMQRDNNEQ